MLLKPEFKVISRLSQLTDQMKELRRNIIIYTDNPLFTDKCEFALFNNSIQVGSIGGIQSKYETLYSTNHYTGEVSSPLLVSPQDEQIKINPEAIVRIKGYTYTNKLIDEFQIFYETNNSFDECFHGNHCTYRNGKSDIESPYIPDPRFYNIDQQFVMTGGNGNAFYVNDGEYANTLLLDLIMREGGGVGYRLGDLLDEYTVIRTMGVKVDDPFNVMEVYGDDFKHFTANTLSIITNSAMLCFADEYHIVIDHDMGYNTPVMKRKFVNMEKKYENTEIKQFFFNLEQIWKDMKEQNWNIRYTLIYKDYKANVMITPLKDDIHNGKAGIREPELSEYIEDFYNQV